MTDPRPTYRVTKFFISGALAGLTHTETATISFPVGFEVPRPAGGGSGYRVITAERIA